MNEELASKLGYRHVYRMVARADALTIWGVDGDGRPVIETVRRGADGHVTSEVAVMTEDEHAEETRPMSDETETFPPLPVPGPTRLITRENLKLDAHVRPMASRPPYDPEAIFLDFGDGRFCVVAAADARKIAASLNRLADDADRQAEDFEKQSLARALSGAANATLFKR